MNTNPTYVCGDVHGQLTKLVNVLQSANLIDDQQHWIGQASTLCFVGDYADRGPDVIGVFDLIMRLEREARASAGRVVSLLGNHDFMMLCAHFLRNEPCGGPKDNFLEDWLRFGQLEDLAKLSDVHIRWIQSLPAIVLLDDVLLAHADAMFYLDHGKSVNEVNDAFHHLITHPDATSWDLMLGEFVGRMAFLEPLHGKQNLDHFLETFGASRIVHGHTPIPIIAGQPAESITEAFVYQQGRCVNVDGGMYLGGSGFLYSLV